jgi:hypothetical protein
MRTLAAVVGGYLLLGAWFALENLPQQMWGCADPDAPHGETFYSDPPHEGCRPTVSLGEHVVAFVTLTGLWLPFLVLRGLGSALG